ncbi:alpha/beta hydrolase [Planococcus sp. N028]|uniref:Alpha/beta hydrolase n=1 Tax=Planococcus shixiaomingii TaxID=3058393 RepID=A0ABT8MZU6_9BACL|nr:alpha/beta hydrolase [Planococcus sp. N028]MDN7241172.1 alpha/beta hydrolase [Planococcus sp. N028]
MAKRMLWFTGIFSSLTALTTVSGFAISNQLMYLKKKDENLILERETSAKRYDEYWYANVKKSDHWIQSANGYSIKAIFLEPHNTNRYAIICHGVTETKVNSFKYARMFERLGFNSVVYDHRRHGDSGGKTTSFGHYEKMDLQAIVTALKAHVGPDLIFGIHGESMGAATTLLYAGMEDSAAFYISDCTYSDISEQILHVMKTKTSLPTAISLKLIGLFLKLRDGYSIRAVSPREVVKNIKSPVLFIHSTLDEFVLPYMTKELYELKPEPKTLKLFDEGAHAQSFNQNPAEYEKTVEEFLEANNLLKN